MRFRLPLIPGALALALFLCAPAALAAAVADKAVLADTLNSPLPLDTGAALAPDPLVKAKPKERGNVSGANARAARRRQRLAAGEKDFEARYQRSLAINAVRDSARRSDNLILGAGLTFHSMVFGSFNDTTDTESSPALGILLGYRNHSSRKLGFKTGLYYHTGLTIVDRDYPYAPGNYGYNRAYGSKGTTSGFEAMGQVVLGPWGRFAFEPGIGYGMGWHSAKAIGLSGESGDTYFPKPRFSTLAAVAGVSLYLGRYDQINPTGWMSLGKVLGEDDALVIQVNAALVVAFREE